MIQLKCPHCAKEIRAAEEHAGKKIRCPKCKEVLTLPAADTAVQSAAPRTAPAAVKKGPPPIPKRPPVDEEQDVPVMEAIEDDDARPVRKARRDEPEDEEEDDEEYERRRRKRKKRKRRQGAYADCPNCNSPGNAQRVAFTWWGGLVGPAILTHVRCNDCGTCYNGRTGKSNNVAIAIYLGVGLLFGVMAGVVAIVIALMNHR
jgi:phage FluMu protein Com